MLGTTQGKYEIVEKLGQGGMAEVYLARHTVLGSQVALKVLRRSAAHNHRVAERLFDEARITATIDHPGIVKTIDVGHCDDKRPFLVMEYLQGDSLRDRLRKQNRIALITALDYIRQLTSALAAAHSAGVIHRDLTPSNIFLVKDSDIPGGERARILDFGIAKNLSSSKSWSTRSGVIMGTPYYMSPEQCRSSSHIDHRSDLYSLGCILFRMVVGRPMFRGMSRGELLSAHMLTQPPEPSQIDPDIPSDVNALILRLLAKNPSDRFDNAEQLLAATSAIILRLESRKRTAAAPVLPPRDSQSPNQTETVLTWYREGSAPFAEPLPPQRFPLVARSAVVLAIIILIGFLASRLEEAGERESRQGAAIPTLAVDQADDPAAGQAGADLTTDQASADLPTDQAARASDVNATVEDTDSIADTTPSPQPDEREPVRIVIDSDPPGANVYQMPESVRIGTTPLVLNRSPLAGELVLYIEKTGFRNASMVIDAEQPGAYKTVLSRTRRSDKTKSRSGIRVSARSAMKTSRQRGKKR